MNAFKVYCEASMINKQIPINERYKTIVNGELEYVDFSEYLKYLFRYNEVIEKRLQENDVKYEVFDICLENRKTKVIGFGLL